MRLLHPMKILRSLYFRSRSYKRMVKKNLRGALDLRNRQLFEHSLDLDNPKSLNEKTQWMELHVDTSLWSVYADKYKVRSHLKELGLERYLTQLYGVWDKVEDIEYDKLPNSFVIKCNHDSKSTYIIKNKKALDKHSLNKKITKHLNHIYGLFECEPHYSIIERKIIAEELLEQGDGLSLIDYKFCCINGKPEYCMVCYDRPASDEKGTAVKDIYSIEPWGPKPETMKEDAAAHSYKITIPLPINYSDMLGLAKVLSAGFPLVYVDMYNIKGRIVFGEMTFTREGGRITYLTEEYQNELGSKIILPKMYSQ